MKEQQKRKFKQIHPEIEDGIDLRRCPLLLPSLLVSFKIRIITLQFIAKFPAAVMAESIDIDDIESQVWKSDSPTIDSAAQFR